MKGRYLRRISSLMIALLACDFLWLAGDNLPGLSGTERDFIRNGSVILAMLIFVVIIVRWAMRLETLRVVGLAAAAVLFTEIVSVLIGYLFFPEQFPRDTSLSQALLGLGIEVLAVCACAILVAGIASSLTRWLKSFPPR